MKIGIVHSFFWSFQGVSGFQICTGVTGEPIVFEDLRFF